MKFYLATILALFLAGPAYAIVAPRQPEVVHFGDKVRVVSGFYAGCRGEVTAEIIENESYMVDLTCRDKFVGGKLLERKVFVLDRYYIMGTPE